MTLILLKITIIIHRHKTSIKSDLYIFLFIYEALIGLLVLFGKVLRLVGL